MAYWESGKPSARRPIWYHIEPYAFILPALIVLVVFRYVPMAGLQIAFRDFIAPMGFFGSPWVGMKHFERFVTSPFFSRVMLNTVRVTFVTLLVSFPWPVLFALGLNELDRPRLKKAYQTITWAPHFVSVVVVVSMIFLFTSPTTGLVNFAIRLLGGEAVQFMMQPGWFLPLYVISNIWQHLGWASIIYLATLSTVSPELHEAAVIDGATRFQRVVRINVPHLVPIIVIQLILQSGQILNVGFEKVFLMQTALNQTASEVLSTYTYRAGILGGQFSFATAVGLMRAAISLMLIIIVNRIARSVGETSLW